MCACPTADTRWALALAGAASTADSRSRACAAPATRSPGVEVVGHGLAARSALTARRGSPSSIEVTLPSSTSRSWPRASSSGSTATSSARASR